MSFSDLLIHTLVVKRMAATGTFDDYGQPVTAASTVATVPGRIRPITAREVPLSSEAGAALSTHIADMFPLAGLDTGCWIEANGVRYDIDGIMDAAGAGHHFMVKLTAVT